MTDAPKTKKSWAKYIHRKDWGGSVRARIQFRKREGRKPTEEEEDELAIPDPEDVTAAEIREALDKGEEVSSACWVTPDKSPD